MSFYQKGYTKMKTSDLLKSFLFFSCAAFIVIFLSCPVAFGQKDAPITITADEMLSAEADNSVTFKGDVDASQGGVRIRSDEMVIYYSKLKDEGDKKEDNVTQKVDKIVCSGNVEITREDWIGTSNKMIYLAKERKILLQGDAKAVQGQNMVNGDQIVYYMDEGRSEVIGGTSTTVGGKDGEEPKKKQRVNMTIIQQ